MTHAPDADRLKVVLDTNIYIAAFEFPRGRNAVLWQAARNNRYRLIVSPAIIRETARVLRSDFGWEDERVERVVRIIADVATVVMPTGTVRAVTADPRRPRSRMRGRRARPHRFERPSSFGFKGWSGIPDRCGSRIFVGRSD